MAKLLTLKDFEGMEEERDDRSAEEKYHDYLALAVCAIKGHVQPERWERGLVEENGIGEARCEVCMHHLADWLPKGTLVEWDLFNITSLQIVMSMANNILDNIKWVPGNG